MVKRLQQEARDGVEEKKIGERKSVAMVRFLKNHTILRFLDQWIHNGFTTVLCKIKYLSKYIEQNIQTLTIR